MLDTTKTHQELVEHQMELELLYAKNQLLPRIRQWFQETTTANYVEAMIADKIPVNFGLDMLAQIALHKQATVGTMVGLLYHHFDDAQATADMLVRACIVADLIDWKRWLGEEGMFTVIDEIPKELQDELDRFQYPLPMVVIPKELTNNRQSGYLLSSGSVILKNNHTEDDVCLDHLNRANSVRLTINADTAQMVKNKWRNLDKRKPDETQIEFEDRKKAFIKYDRCSKYVMATLMKHSDHFYLTHKYDKRGRIYCQGYHVSYQGTTWNKALIEFYDKELVE